MNANQGNMQPLDPKTAERLRAAIQKGGGTGKGLEIDRERGELRPTEHLDEGPTESRRNTIGKFKTHYAA